MSGALSSIIVMIVFFAVITKAIKKSAEGSTKSKFSPRQSQPVRPTRPRGFTNYRPHKDIISVSRDMGDSKGSTTLRDDRNNDWLARQLREEHKAFKETSEMFDLKIEHASHCDARYIEQFHRRNCDARGVDLANGKTANIR